MTVKSVCSILCIPFILYITACNGISGKDMEKIERHKKSLDANIGEKFPIDNIVDSTGKLIKLDFSESEITIIDFWFNECPPCIEEMKQFAGVLKGKDKEINVFSISINGNTIWKSIMKEPKGRFSFLSSHLSNWKHYNLQSQENENLKNNIPMDNIKELQEKLNVAFYPAYFVLDRSGII